MSQNSMRYNWTSEEVDEKLHNIMKSIFNNSVAAAEKYGLGFDLIKGANIAGFEKVVEARFLKESINKQKNGQEIKSLVHFYIVKFFI